jgi:hypothetical protein
VSTGIELTIAIYNHFWDHLTTEERNDPQWSPDNDDAWDIFFVRQLEDRLAAYDGNDDSPSNYNITGRRRWWSVLEICPRGNNKLVIVIS